MYDATCATHRRAVTAELPRGRGVSLGGPPRPPPCAKSWHAGRPRAPVILGTLARAGSYAPLCQVRPSAEQGAGCADKDHGQRGRCTHDGVGTLGSSGTPEARGWQASGQRRYTCMWRPRPAAAPGRSTATTALPVQIAVPIRGCDGGSEHPGARRCGYRGSQRRANLGEELEGEEAQLAPPVARVVRAVPSVVLVLWQVLLNRHRLHNHGHAC